MLAKSGGIRFRSISFFLQLTKNVRNSAANVAENKELFFIIEVFKNVFRLKGGLWREAVFRTLKVGAE
jgi:hypothetical protein